MSSHLNSVPLGPRVLGIGVSGKVCGFVVLDDHSIRHLEIRTLRHPEPNIRERALQDTIDKICGLCLVNRVVVEKPGPHKLRYESVRLTSSLLERLVPTLPVPSQCNGLRKARKELCQTSRPTRKQVGQVLAKQYPNLSCYVMPESCRYATDRDKYWQHVLDATTLAWIGLQRACSSAETKETHPISNH